MKTRVLYVNRNLPPMSGPGIWRAVWFLRHLSGPRFEFTVLCADRRQYWQDAWDPSLQDLIPESVRVERVPARFPDEVFWDTWPPIREAMKGFRPWRLWKHVVNYGPTAGEIFGDLWPDVDLIWAYRASRAGIELGRRVGFDCIVSSGPPHIVHLVGLIVASRLGIRWIMDYRDPWMDDPELAPRRPFARFLFARLERAAIRRADAVTVVTPTWRDMLMGAHGGPAGKFHVVRNGTHIRDLPAPHGTPAETLHIHFNGTPQRNAWTPTFFAALADLRRRRRPGSLDLRVTFTGLSPEQQDLVHRLGLSDVVEDLGRMSLDDSLRHCMAADVLLVLVAGDLPVRAGVIPAKTYEAMGLGKPILAVVPRTSDVREVLDDYGPATVCDVGDIADIVGALQRVLDDPERRRPLEEPVRRQFAERYGREAQAREMGRILAGAGSL